MISLLNSPKHLKKLDQYYAVSWRRKWKPTLVLLHGKSHGQRSLVGYSPWGRSLDTTEQLHFTHFILYRWRRKWQPTPVFLPGESHGQRSLAGHGPWGRRESDTTEVTEHNCLSASTFAFHPLPIFLQHSSRSEPFFFLLATVPHKGF